MLFGLAIGLSVAYAVYVKDREPFALARQQSPPPASLQTSLDNAGEIPANTPSVAGPVKKRFDFYDLLPLSEVIIVDEVPVVHSDVEPQAVEEPGVYMLQAGSFSTHTDADRRRAELALHGIESHIGRAQVNGRNYHRVYVGPIEDLDRLNMLRSRLRAAKIDVFRIRLGD
jgi:cell division protein FtsN